MLPIRPGSRRGYLILQEYFARPDKFLFARLARLEAAFAGIEAPAAEILVLLDHLPTDLQGKLRPENFRLGCTPAVNLFPHQADPIRVTGRVVDYPIVPDSRSPRSYEV